jgi:hypothetical protein
MIMKTGAATTTTTTLMLMMMMMMMMESRSDVTHLCITTECFRCRRHSYLNKLDSVDIIYLFLMFCNDVVTGPRNVECLDDSELRMWKEVVVVDTLSQHSPGETEEFPEMLSDDKSMSR